MKQEIENVIKKCVDKNIHLWTENGKLHFKCPQGALDPELRNEVVKMKPYIIEYLEIQKKNKITHNQKDHLKEFPITDIQAAYLVGRNDAYTYGGIGCKVYAEFLTEFTDQNRFLEAVKTVVKRQDMLRVKVNKEGKQFYSDTLSELPLKIFDLRQKSKVSREEVHNQLREKLQFKQYNPEQDTLFDIALCIISEEEAILYLSLDMLLGDFVSIQILLNDLYRVYLGEQLPAIDITYRDFILYKEKEKENIEYQNNYKKDKEYWSERLLTFPHAPEIPKNEQNEEIISGRFYHKDYLVLREDWTKIEYMCSRYGVTPTAVILTIYCEVLAKWSQNKDFLINITTLSRPAVHSQISELIGDFTTTTIFEAKVLAEKTFVEKVRSFQTQLFEDLGHNLFNGVEVLRELKRMNRDSVVPYVFTSTLGAEEMVRDKINVLYKISQTPQVLIDCQLSKQVNGVMINWDIRTGVFSKQLVDDMFEVFQNAIKAFYSQNNGWESKFKLSLPYRTRIIRNQVNATQHCFKNTNLITGIYDSIRNMPNKKAIITYSSCYTYRELGEYIGAIEFELMANDIQCGDRVGILLDKGIWQVATVIAVLSLGAVYVPIDREQPLSRQEMIMEQAKIKFSVVQEPMEKTPYILISEHSNPSGIMTPFYGEIEPEMPAYVIFTSGSTGTPKGVEMSHGAAMNTILDVCQKYKVSKNDRAFGISNLFFDLSVFDIFGILSIGGTLVIPMEKKKRDVAHWAYMCNQNKVTLLNMVPAQMEMYLAYLDANKINKKNTLRLLLLSGDWISANLVRKIYAEFPEVMCIGLGGATEAGIWSIYYRTDQLKPTDKTVPYGVPLANQKFYILDENGEPCPDYVIGEICIAGESLAIGYFNDSELTNQKFQFSELLDERIYKTGDLGRYRENGIIEFIGRKDSQIKINGYRVELGEIENTLRRHPQISNAVVLKESDSSLVAYVHAIDEGGKQNIFKERFINEETELNIPFTQEEFSQWIKLADKTALMYILKTLLEANIFVKIGQMYSFEDIADCLHLKPTYTQLLMRWLKALVNMGYILQEGDFYYTTQRYTMDIAQKSEKEWLLCDKKINYSELLMQYIHDSANKLKEILSARIHPHSLLFPQGKLDIAYAAYKDNVVSRNINKITRKQIQSLVCNNMISKKKVRILEVGAGTGGSSLELIHALDGQGEVEYYFTDISNFFFNEAKEKLKKYKWVRYKLYDINKENWEQGFEGEKFDVILCANVLHNAFDLEKTLQNLKELLTLDGELFIIEETKERYALMTSVEFEFAETAQTYYDDRDYSKTIFISYENWKANIERLHGKLILTYPQKNDRLYPAGQELMVVKFDRSNSLNEKEVKCYIRNQLPNYMIPGKIRFVNELPITTNGKIDRRLLQTTLRDEEKENYYVTAETMDELEKRIRNIWCSVIGCNDIQKDDDFYSIGGDSLLVAQVTSKMLKELPEAKDWEWDRLMLELMKNTTISKIATCLRSNHSKMYFDNLQVNQVSPLIVFKEPSEKNISSKVLFHTGTGTLSSYQELLPYLIDKCGNNQEIIGFNFGEAKDYLERPVDTWLIDSAKVYADNLMERKAEEFELIGYCVGGWIALETAKLLTERGREVKKVTIISSSLCGHNFDNEILLERAFGLSIGADVERAGYIGKNEILQNALSELNTVNENRGITIEELCQLSGKYKEIGEGFEKLKSMKQKERLRKVYENLSDNEADSEENIQMFELLYRMFSHSFRGLMRYKPSGYVGDVHALFVKDDTKHFFPIKNISNEDLWKEIVLGKLTIDYIPGEHGNCLKEPHVGVVAKLIDE